MLVAAEHENVSQLHTRSVETLGGKARSFSKQSVTLGSCFSSGVAWPLLTARMLISRSVLIFMWFAFIEWNVHFVKSLQGAA